MNLREYQQKAVEWAKTSDGLIISPAGSGKTWIAASIIKHYHEFYPDMSFGWMAPTRETCQQARTSLRVAGVPDEIVDVLVNVKLFPFTHWLSLLMVYFGVDCGCTLICFSNVS